MSRGIIFDIKEFAIYDGPGIRTTIFFKGCPLRCKWCHNPEGLAPAPQLMVSINNCTHCGRCAAVCPTHTSHCTLCGKCIPVCPLHLRRICGSTWDAKALARHLLLDADYLRNQEGGITFSGGEPSYQPDFLLEIAKHLPSMHKCIETCGHCNAHTFQAILEQMDYIIMDLKLINPEKHRFYTGVDNALILNNLNQLKHSNKPFTIRIPVIPGVNDDNDNFSATAKLLLDARSLERVELLPYHVTAAAKYPMIRRAYHDDFLAKQPPNLNTDIFAQYQIPCIHL